MSLMCENTHPFRGGLCTNPRHNYRGLAGGLVCANTPFHGWAYTPPLCKKMSIIPAFCKPQSITENAQYYAVLMWGACVFFMGGLMH